MPEKFPTQPTKPGDQPIIEHPEPVKIPEGVLKAKPEEKIEFPKGAEKPEVEAETMMETTVFETPEGKKAKFVEIPGKAAFDIGKALETPGFFEFLNKHAGQKIDELDMAQTKQLFDAFEASNTVRDFYKEIGKDIGIELENAEIQPSLDAFFVAVKDFPGYAEKMRGCVKEYKELPEKIAAKEQQLNQLGGREKAKAEEESFKKTWERINNLGAEVGKLTRMQEMSESMSGIKGFFNVKKNSELLGWIFRTKEESEARKRTASSWRNEIKTIKRAVENLSAEARKSADRVSALAAQERTTEQLKENMDALRKLFFGGYFEPAKNILALSRQKLKERLSDLASPKKDVKKLEEGLGLLETIAKKDIEYLGKEEIGKFRTGFDKLIERKTTQNIREKMAKLKLGETGSLGNLEKQLKKFFSVEKLGMKDKEAATDFIRKRLESYIRMAVPPKGEMAESFRAKKLAIKVILLKLEQ